MAREWYRSSFDELYLLSYGLGLERASAEAAFAAEKLDLAPGAAILDLACGHGRHATELARSGYAVTGLDLSRHLLSKAEELAAQAGVKVEWVEEDMRAIPETWAARFSGIICLFTSWGYFEKDADNEKVIEGVARSLKLGGRFLLDVINRDWLVRSLRGRTWRESDSGAITVEETRLDLPSSRADSRNTIVLPDGRREVRHVSVRLFTLAEVRAMVERHGLEVTATHGDWQGAPYSVDSPRLIVVAERAR